MRKQEYGPKGASKRWNGIYWTVSKFLCRSTEDQYAAAPAYRKGFDKKEVSRSYRSLEENKMAFL